MKNSSSIRLLTILLVSSLLSACAGMPISSMYKLRDMEPQDIVPKEVEIAVITHQGVKLADGSANLVLGYQSPDPEYNFSTNVDASLVKNPDIEILQSNRRDFEDITLFYLEPEAAASLAVAQNKIVAIKQLEIEGGGSLSVNVNHGCAEGKRPAQLKAKIYVKFNNNLGFILMASGVDLNKANDGTNKPDFWQECESTGQRMQQPH